MILKRSLMTCKAQRFLLSLVHWSHLNFCQKNERLYCQQRATVGKIMIFHLLSHIYTITLQLTWIFFLFFLSLTGYWTNSIHSMCQNEEKFFSNSLQSYLLSLHLNSNIWIGILFSCYLSSMVMRLLLKLVRSTLNISVVLQKPFTICCFWLLLKDISVKNLKTVFKPNFPQTFLLFFFVITHVIKIINFLKEGFKGGSSWSTHSITQFACNSVSFWTEATVQEFFGKWTATYFQKWDQKI